MEKELLDLKKELADLKKQVNQNKKKSDIDTAIFKLNHIVALEIGLVYLLIITFGESSDKITILNATIQSNVIITIASAIIIASMWKEMHIVSKWLFSKIIGVKS